ncbi:MAG: tRNA (adenosine(37)-N6)-threonylcarbamoyltransferase complex dimerization subunit type 1 TsaB [Candidatus Fermentibacteraceae bacterium]
MRGAWLGFDTVFGNGGAALVADRVVRAVDRIPGGVPTSGGLLLSIGAVLRSAGIDGDSLEGISFTMGPGSYTGLRIAVATARGLSAGWGVPLKGVPTLRLLSYGVDSSQPVLAAVRARNCEVFAALYASSDPFSRELLRAGVYSGADIGGLAVSHGAVAVGAGRSEINEPRLAWVRETLDAPDASSCAVLGSILANAQGFDPNPEPLYLRGFMQKADSLDS